MTDGAFGVRGVVEGFYGPPWTHDARLEMISFLAERDMNAYAYAPKDDAKHRAGWREPYDAQEMHRFGELTSNAKAVGVRFGFALSPGLDITYESAEDRARLLEKLLALADVGVGWFLLLLDDIPVRADLAPRQSDLANAMWDALRTAVPGVNMTVCPTEYVGTQRSPYLTDLAAGLPPEVDVMWTGPTVCSPTITTADARARADALGGRAPLVWDNYPVNDATMTSSLHLGPYRGRDADLAGAVGGVLCNPMSQARASKVALATAAAFLSSPERYEVDSAWRGAIAAAGGAYAEPLTVLARACSDSAIETPERGELARLVAELRDQIDQPDWSAALTHVAGVLRAARALPDAFADDALGDEVAPWARAAQTEAEAGLAALRLLQHVRPIARVVDGRGRAAAPDAERALEHAFVMLFLWKATRANDHVVFGPRFAVYTPVIQLAGGRPGLDVAQAVREDGNAVDALCRLALDAYDDWSADADAGVRVFVDGEERDVAPDGSFDGRGETTLLRAGRHATRVDGPPPFRDARLP